MMDPQAIRSFLDARLDGYLQKLKQIVSINSFTTNPAGVSSVADVTAGYFAELGFQAKHIPSRNSSFGNHLVLSRAGTSSDFIGLVSHHDTVFSEEDEALNDFRWRIEGSRAYGPGTNDIKGGTIVILMVLEALRAFAPEAFQQINWRILIDASEEIDGSHFAEICLAELPVSHTLACLIFEMGFLADGKALVVQARKGMATYRVESSGRGAHAGTSHRKGANALVKLASAITELAKLTDYAREVTVNVGSVAGGGAVNRVPHAASAVLEMRAFDRDIFDQTAKAIESVKGEPVRSEDDGFEAVLTVEKLGEMAPWPVNPATDRLLNYWIVAGREAGIVVEPERRGGLSDGNLLCHVLPCLDGLGPSGANAHCSERSADGAKDQEYVSIPSLVAKSVINALAIERLIAAGK